MSLHSNSPTYLKSSAYQDDQSWYLKNIPEFVLHTHFTQISRFCQIIHYKIHIFALLFKFVRHLQNICQKFAYLKSNSLVSSAYQDVQSWYRSYVVHPYILEQVWPQPPRSSFPPKRDGRRLWRPSCTRLSKLHWLVNSYLFSKIHRSSLQIFCFFFLPSLFSSSAATLLLKLRGFGLIFEIEPNFEQNSQTFKQIKNDFKLS